MVLTTFRTPDAGPPANYCPAGVPCSVPLGVSASKVVKAARNLPPVRASVRWTLAPHA